MRILTWIIIQSIVITLAWRAYAGNVAAHNFLNGLVIVHFLMILIASRDASVKKACEEKGPPVPSFVNYFAGVSFTAFFIFAGWYWIGILTLLSEQMEQSLFKKDAPPK